MKSIKDFNPKFGTVNYRTDICIIAIEQNTSYSMAASEVVEIYIRENQQQNLHLRKSTTKSTFGSSHLELIWKKMLSRSRQNSWKMSAKRPNSSCSINPSDLHMCQRNLPDYHANDCMFLSCHVRVSE